MSLVRWNPLQEFNSIQQQMNRVIDNVFGSSRFHLTDQQLLPWEPVVDIREDEDAFYVYAEIPGVKKEDVKITMNNNLLSIRGEKKQEIEKSESNYHRIERSFGSFERTFTLPLTVKTDRITAAFTDGVLRVDLPKTEEAKPKEIQINIK